MATIRTLLLNILLLAAACGDNKQASSSPATQTASPAAGLADTLAPKAETDSVKQPDLSPGIEHPDEVEPQSGGKLEEEINELKDAIVKIPVQSAPQPAQPAAPAPAQPIAPSDDPSFAKHGFSDVATLDPSIRLDIRYATANNFTKSKIYDCPRCLLRPEAAKALVKAHKALQKKGYGLKMYDCYRPRPYQQRLWDKVPNPDYVTPPSKGSMHSRGAAVDLTVVDKNGKELDMGTPYDYFGKAAHTDNTNLPAHVLANRKMLREVLEAVGFKGIRTEWWHFSYEGKNYPLSDYVWPCKEKE